MPRTEPQIDRSISLGTAVIYQHPISLNLALESLVARLPRLTAHEVNTLPQRTDNFIDELEVVDAGLHQILIETCVEIIVARGPLRSTSTGARQVQLANIRMISAYPANAIQLIGRKHLFSISQAGFYHLRTRHRASHLSDEYNHKAMARFSTANPAQPT